MKLKVVLLALAALLLGACSHLTSDGVSPEELARARKIFVEERLNDNLGIDRAIVSELRSLGYEADRGPLTMMPESAQLIVTYDARETWDFRPYVIELNLAVRPAQDYNRVVASSRYVRPGVTNKSPEAMVKEALGKLFTAVN